MKSDRVIVIGLDGASFNVMRPWIEAGKLPNIRELMENGSYGELESTIHPLSPQAWTSFMTGKNAGKHGIFDFTWRRPHSYEVQLTNASYREGKSLWKILSEYGRKVGVVNVPMTFPPEEVDGFMISGMDTPGENSNYMYPETLKREIHERFGKYIIGLRLWEYSRKGKYKVLLEKLIEMVRLRTEVCLYLLESRKPEFFMVVYRATDVVQHIFWKYHDRNHPLHCVAKNGLGDAIYRVYQEADTAIGKLRDALDDTWSIIVMSDHGAGGNSDKSVYLNSWLEAEGLLKYLETPERRGTILSDRLQQYLLMGKGRLAKYIPAKLKLDLQRVFPQLFDKVVSVSYFSHIDWSKTKVYSEEIRTNIWINLEGREPQGIVPKGEYQAVRQQVIEKLQELRNPDTGKPIFSKIYKKEEIYEGRFLDWAPDLVLLQDQDEYELVPRSSLNLKGRKAIRIPTETEFRTDIKPSGGHRLNGILIGNGKNFRKGVKVDANIMDVAPTILHVMRCPISDDMDGKVITGMIESDFLDSNEIKFVSGLDKESESVRTDYDQEEEKRIKEELKSLGYL